MKNILKSYFYHPLTEKRGILILLIVLAAALLTSVFTLHYFVPAPAALHTDTALSAAWSDFKIRHSSATETHSSDHLSSKPLFPFDPNTLDSTGFVELGLKPITVKMLLNWRRKGKVFYRKEEFKALYTLSEKEYNALAPYIVIHREAKEKNAYKNEYRNAYLPPPDFVDINTTDSATLVRLRGIGPYFAHKLLERRNALGGYIKPEQFKEAYRFHDTTYAMLKEKLVINPNALHKINLNTATETQLKAHPYIGEQTAKNILLYRNAIHRFEKIEQLRMVPLMNEEIYRKIAPYLRIE